jgi:hypothetical protein
MDVKYSCHARNLNCGSVLCVIAQNLSAGAEKLSQREAEIWVVWASSAIHSTQYTVFICHCEVKTGAMHMGSVALRL